MKLFNKMATIALTSAVAFGAQSASAAPILNFGGQGGTPVTAVNNGAGSTTISATDASVFITFIIGGGPTAAYLTFSATNIGPAVLNGSDIVQQFAGTFSVTSGVGGSGTNFLSGDFIDTVTGSGNSVVMQASQPPGSVNFNSGVIPAGNLALGRGMAFSLSSVDPDLAIVAGSIGSFTAAISGTFSAENRVVPEPATMVLMGLGMLGAGVARRRRQ